MILFWWCYWITFNWWCHWMPHFIQFWWCNWRRTSLVSVHQLATQWSDCFWTDLPFMFMHRNVNLCLCLHLCLCLIPKLILWAYTNVVCDSLFCGGSGGMAHSTPTDQKPSIVPIFVHSSAGIRHPKRKACRGRVGYSKQEANGRLWHRCKVMQRRVDRRGRACWEAEAVQWEMMLQPAKAKEATWQPVGALKGSGTSRGCGTMRSHATIKRANGRQQRIDKWWHTKMDRGSVIIGDATSSRDD